MSRIGWWRLIAVAAVAILVEEALITGVAHSRLVQTVVGLPLVLFLPGAALRSACQVDASDGVGDLLLLPIGLSMAVVIVGGVILNFLPFGLTDQVWIVYLSVVIGFASLAGIARTNVLGTTPLGIRKPTVQGALAALIAATCLTAGYFVARSGAHDQRYPGFAQLWLTGAPAGKEYDLGVSSYLRRSARFTVELQTQGSRSRRWSVVLRPAESWSRRMALPPGRFARATLIRPGHGPPYRRVEIFTAR